MPAFSSSLFPERYAGGADRFRTAMSEAKPVRPATPNVWLKFYKNPHFRSLVSGKEPPQRTGCESCHGPGKAHVDASGGKLTIIAFSSLSQSRSWTTV